MYPCVVILSTTVCLVYAKFVLPFVKLKKLTLVIPYITRIRFDQRKVLSGFKNIRLSFGFYEHNFTIMYTYAIW